MINHVKNARRAVTGARVPLIALVAGLVAAVVVVGCAPDPNAGGGATTSTTTTIDTGDPVITQYETSSVNKWTPGRSGTAITTVVIQDSEANWDSSVASYQFDSGKSVHYLVNTDGHIAQFVAETDTAWFAGNWPVNLTSIGVSHVGFQSVPGSFTNAEYDASARLVAAICKRWSIPIDRTHIIGQNEVPNPNIPGEFGGVSSRTDPGPNWDWNHYMSLVAAYAAG